MRGQLLRQAIARFAAHRDSYSPEPQSSHNENGATLRKAQPAKNTARGHLIRQLQVSGKVLGAERDGSNACAGSAYGRCVHHTTGCFYPRDDAKAVAEIERRLNRTKLGVDAANVIRALHLLPCPELV